MSRAGIVLCVIALPAAALIVELTSAPCAEQLFDPLPSRGHALLVALVPVSGVGLLAALALPARRHLRNWAARVAGVATGVAVVYSLVFLPLVPLAVPMIVVGLGLLALAPHLALLLLLRSRTALRRAAEPGPVPLPRLWAWTGVGLALFLAVDAPGAITAWAAGESRSASEARRAIGLRVLRRVADRESLLRMCYDRDRSLSLVGGWLRPTPSEARQTFFLVTGRPFNDFPPPPNKWTVARNWSEDTERGGTEVAGRVAGLSLASSTIETQVDPVAGLAHSEWTLAFHNASADSQEARAEVALPPGGVVSGVTLWVNSEPREATFAETGQVREAYETVVRVQRRDPLLVTARGPDRVLVQCFPVPPAGRMQIRLAVTAPLIRRPGGPSALRLPAFSERNFDVEPSFVHDVKLASPAQVTGGTDLRADGAARYAGRWTDPDLRRLDNGLTVDCPGPAAAWTADPLGTGRIVQEVAPAAASPARRLVVVVDGSARVAPHFAAIAAGLANVRPETELTVLAAGDRVWDLSPVARRPADILDRLRADCGVGGSDSVPALLQALDRAGDDAALIWIHGPQPVVVQPVNALADRLRSRPAAVRLHAVAVELGPNRVLHELRDLPQLRLAPRCADLAADLAALIGRLDGTTDEPAVTWRRVEGAAAGPQAQLGSRPLAALWARDRVAALLPDGRAEAVRVGSDYRVVTPATGAVVLETKEQYSRAGLKPYDADPDPSASGPEPAVWLLLLVAAGVAAGELWRRRRSCRAA